MDKFLADSCADHLVLWVFITKYIKRMGMKMGRNEVLVLSPSVEPVLPRIVYIHL
jgi:hypothetical protein